VKERKKNLFRQSEDLGRPRKAGVSASVERKKPNLVFRSPTYKDRDASFFPARQGGGSYECEWATRPFLPFIVLTVRCGEWIIIKSMKRLIYLLKVISVTIFLQGHRSYDLGMVDHIDSMMKQESPSPSL